MMVNFYPGFVALLVWVAVDISKIIHGSPATDGNRTTDQAKEQKTSKLDSQIEIIDPSELMRPEPEFAMKEVYRDFSVDEKDPLKERLRQTYVDLHTHMTVDFVKEKREKWLKFNTAEMDIMTALEKLNELIDESDPDADFPNIVHSYQTAERIRADFPDEDWFHFTGLIHDMGKIMAFYNEPQWCVVGDTFPVGCAWGKSIVYRDTTFTNNPDTINPKYNTKYGMYEPNCGLDNVLMCWGHDEYLYQVLKYNKCKLPEKALYMIRYHSFYPWHKGGDYDHLCSEKDMEMKKWIILFNKYDLYTKGGVFPDIDKLRPYYDSLVEKFCPGKLKW